MGPGPWEPGTSLGQVGYQIGNRVPLGHQFGVPDTQMGYHDTTNLECTYIFKICQSVLVYFVHFIVLRVFLVYYSLLGGFESFLISMGYVQGSKK